MTKTAESSTKLDETLLGAIPMPVFVVNYDLEVLQTNPAARGVLDESGRSLLRGLGGQVLGCINSTAARGGCGRSQACQSCVLRNSVGEAISSGEVVRRRARLELIRGGKPQPVYLLVTASPVPGTLPPQVLVILEDIAEIVEVGHLLPICANCKKVREGPDSWAHFEAYFKDRLDVDFSHGVCPQCAKKLYPGYLHDEAD